MEKQEECTIAVFPVDASVRRENLLDFFGELGKIESLTRRETDVFLQFADAEDARRAIKRGRYHKFGKTCVVVTTARQRKRLVPEAAVVFTNLSPKVTRQEFERICAQASGECFVETWTRNETNGTLQGQVRYFDASHACLAPELLDGTVLHGTPLRVSPCYSLADQLHRTMVVWNFPKQVSEQDLYWECLSLCQQFGPIDELALQRVEQEAVLCAWVTYCDPDSAVRAFEELRVHTLGGNVLEVDWRPSPDDVRRRLFCYGLKLTLQQSDLTQAFSVFGGVVDVSVGKHGCGVISFQSSKDMEHALTHAPVLGSVRECFSQDVYIRCFEKEFAF